MTISEARLWSAIRRGATGARFRRQVPVGPWIADFASLEPKLVVEVDGPTHDDEDPAVRTAYLNDRGFTVVRFTNKEIAQDLPNVVSAIAGLVEHLVADPSVPPAVRTEQWSW